MDLKIDRKYILDTSVFIDSLRGDVTYKPRARWIMFQSKDTKISAGFSVITEIELWRGIKGMWTPQQHETLLIRLRRYSLISRIARRAGLLRGSLDQLGLKGPGLFDCVIAATAEHYELVLVTRNKKDYQLLLENNLAKFVIGDYT